MRLFRRPLRIYLFETLLLLTVVTFILQVGYVFLPIFNDHHEDESGGDERTGRDENIPGVVHQREVRAQGASLSDKGDHNEPLLKQQIVDEGKKDKAVVDKEPQDTKQRAIKPVAKKSKNRQKPKPGQAPQNPPIKPKGYDIKQQDTGLEAKNVDVNLQHGDIKQKKVENKPKAADVKLKNNAKAKHQAGQKSAAKLNKYVCHKKIMILGGMKIVETWRELSTLVSFLKEYPNENNVTYRAPLECPKQKCTVELTFSSNYTGQVPGKDAVILNVAPYTLKSHMGNLLKKNQPQDQLWMFYGVETALRIHKWMHGIGHLQVHGVWSYLSNSEIHMPYAYYKPGPPVTNKERKPNNFWTQSKNKLIAWMGSNCVKEVFWPRMEFIEELQKHIHVDTYGKCGNLTCLPRLSDECKHLMSSYKFYLSLENAECDEYITEKMWDTALQHGVVPVVYGAPKTHYERLAPPNSFIYAGDFKTVKALADYLKQLDRRPDLYAKYFEWRYKGSVIQVYPDLQPSKFCQVLPFIEKLEKGKLEKKPISTLPWFNTCRNKITKVFNPKDIPSLQKWKPW